MDIRSPPVHDLVGREAELAEASRLLRGAVRLLTLTGPPGVGKTRLAQEITARTSAEHADGAVFVDLSAARDRLGALGEVARAIGVAGGVGQRTGLKVHHALLERELLLVLDDADQVDGLADELTSILRDCPGVQILVTSRERMHLSQEHELAVAPLDVPTAEVHGVAEIGACAAVRLFVAAARSAWPDFRVTDANAAAVAEICIRLDGLPLALLLAAARIRLFSAADIAARLRDRRAILQATSRDVPDRHRTLRATISWSDAVLGPAERRLFRRLSVFEGAWTLAAAEQVCTEPGEDLVGALGSLVDKSLVQRDAADGAAATFSLLASLREYAAEQLVLHGEGDLLAERRDAYCIRRAHSVEETIGTSREGKLWDWTTRHEGDLRVSLDRCAADPARAEGALVLATALGWAWYTRGHLGEAVQVLEDVLRAAERAAVRPRADVLTAARIVAAVVAWGRADLDRAEALLEPARADCVERSDARRLAMTCAYLGNVARERGQLDAARAWHEQAGRLFDEVGSARGAAWARFDLGRVAWRRGDLDGAAELLRVALRGFGDVGYRWAVGWSAWALGNVDLERGHPDDGAGLLLLALTEFEATTDLRGVASACECLAVVATVRSRHVDALHLVGLAAALRLRIDVPLTQDDADRVERVERAARRALGDFAAERERRVGGTLPPSAGLRLAQDIAGPERDRAVPGQAGALLTPREREVARLVAEGCTNQQIGRRLAITPRTAETHVHHIMGKLDARSRTEVAVWAAMHGLSAGSAR